MEKQFVPYELAVKLKKLGFDEECMSFYNQSGSLNLSRIDNFNWVIRNSNSQVVKLKCVSAPLWQQVFEWFREKYNLDSYVRKITYREWKLEINYILQNDSKEEWERYKKFQDCKETYKEVRQACLEKLIELVENEKNK